MFFAIFFTKIPNFLTNKKQKKSIEKITVLYCRLSQDVRFIAIQENVDTFQNVGTEMMPFHNIFNEWYAAQTSKKVRAVWKSKSDKS